MWISLKSNGCISSVIQNEQRNLHYQRTSLLTSEYYAIYTVWWINLLIPYLHCTCLRRITAPRPPELIRCTVASFWSVFLRCITKDRLLVYFSQIIIIIVSLALKASATGNMFDKSIVYRHPTLSCDDASFPCHNVFSWKLFIVKCVLNVNSIWNWTIQFEFIWENS